MIENAINPIVLSDSDAPAPVIVARTEEEVVPVVLARTKAGTQTFSQSDWKEENVSSLAYIKNKPTIPSDSLQITYESPEATTHNVANVEAALDKLFKKVFFTELKIEDFYKSDRIYTYEIGTEISSITFKAKTNVIPGKYKITKKVGLSEKDIITNDNPDNTILTEIKTFDTPINSQTSFILYCYQTDLSNTEQSYDKNFTLNFYHKLYKWVDDIAIPTEITKTDGTLSANGNSKLNIKPSNQYFHFAYPVSWGTPSVKIGGFGTTGTITDINNFENNSGYTSNYRIYSTNQKIGNGGNVEVEITFIK